MEVGLHRGDSNGMGEIINNINDWMLTITNTIGWWAIVQWIVALVIGIKISIKNDKQRREIQDLKVRIFDFEVMGKEYYEKHYKRNNG